jgi:bifunctional non-homologous end joining protein LigD
MKPLFIEKSPFNNPPRVPEKIQWMKPKLVCEVAFAEWTDDEQLRRTVFLGWRDDKDPPEVLKELFSGPAILIRFFAKLLVLYATLKTAVEPSLQ